MTSTAEDLAQRRRALDARQQAALALRLQQAAQGRGPHARGRVPRREVAGPVPLSYAQQRLWFLDQLSPGNPFYNVPAVLPWPGRLDLRALQWAVDEVVRRHESLRTVFRTTEGQPVQVVLPPRRQRLRLLDLRSVEPARRALQAEAVAAREVTTPFDLSAGPLLRVAVVRLEEGDYRLLITIHHIVSDGWSMGVLLRELHTLYLVARQGRPSPLPEPELQYADFAVWQRSWLTGDRLHSQLAYWRDRLTDLPVLELPTDFPRPDVATYRGENLPVRVEPQITARVRALAAAEGATPFMVLLTAWAAVLHRATGQTDLPIGAPIANRQRPELEPLIGFFVNSLALRVDAAGDPSGRELLHRVKATTLEAYAHQDLPFEKLVEELQPERDPSRNPFTQVTFQLQNAPTADGELPEDEGIHLTPGTGTSILDLAFSLWETRTALVGMAQFSTDLFERATVRRLMNAYTVLLGELVEQPETAISRLRLLTDVQRSRVVVRSAPPSVPLGPPSTLDALVVASCRAHPGLVAVQAGAESCTYAELDRWSEEVAAAVRAAGAAPGSVVGVRVGRRLQLVAALLGVLRAGCAYLPLDEEIPGRRLHAVLADARVRLVLTDADAPTAAPLPDTVRPLAVPPLPGDHDRGHDGQGSAPRAPADPAYVLFTSGSTGAPLGIQVPHRAIVNHMRWMQADFPLHRGDRVLQRTPVHFDASVWEFWAPLLAGARLVLYPGRWAADTAALVDVLRTAEISVLQVVPSLLALLLDEPAFAMAGHLRRVFCGGEALAPALVERFHDTWRDGARRELVNLYGPTEATIDATAWRCEPGDRRARVPIGRPVANTAAYVLDQHQEPVPTGFIGELHLAGEALSDGYVNRPRLTAERFVPDPFSRAPRLMHRTRDLVRRRADGALEFVRRADGLLKVRGLRIEPAEVERCLTEHPDVDEALVMTRPGPAGDDQLVAYVTVGQAADDAHVDSELVAQHVEDWRALYQDLYADGSHHHERAQSRDASFDIVGWNSSYDGRPLPAPEMRAWLDETVQRVLALRPRRVLEVGAGTGLVALRVAPHCQDYLAVDFSAAAVAALHRTAVADGLEPRLRVARLAAHELESLEGEFDTIVLNSVLQYFPGLDYLERSLAAAVERLADGGSVFLGDVRSLPLLAPLHLSVLLHQASDDEPLRAALDERLRQEEELVVDPRWFAGLVDRLPLLTSACIRPKATEHANELTRFRYDVVLATGTPPALDRRPVYLDWERDVQTAERLGSVLAAQSGPVAVLGVPNGRVGPEAAALGALARGDANRRPELRRFLSTGASPTDPHDAVRRAEAAGLAAQPLWTRTGPDGRFDLVVAPTGEDLAQVTTHVAVDLRPTPATGPTAATAPLRRRVGQRLVPALRALAEERLPAYMVPGRVVVLPTLPRRPNGKVDRGALPPPDGERPLDEADYVPPDGPLETLLAEAWAEVLGLQRVGAADDFFADLGGHSLLATQLVSRVRDLLEAEVPLRLVFEAPTVAGLARALLRDLPEPQAAHVRDRAALLLAVREMSEHEAEELLRRPSPPLLDDSGDR